MKPEKKKPAKIITNSSHGPRLRAEIESRAYDLWLAGGRRQGNDLAHWLQAERELLGGEPRTPVD